MADPATVAAAAMAVAVEAAMEAVVAAMEAVVAEEPMAVAMGPPVPHPMSLPASAAQPRPMMLTVTLPDTAADLGELMHSYTEQVASELQESLISFWKGQNIPGG